MSNEKPEKRAPVQGLTGGIPWSLHLEAYDAYCKRYGRQEALIDLEGRNCRGGFGVNELDMLIPGWREKLSELTRLNKLLDARLADRQKLLDARLADRQKLLDARLADMQKLQLLVAKVHAAKGRYHNQLAMCDLFDACSLPNVRPEQEVVVALSDSIPIEDAIAWQENGTGVERNAVMVSGRSWYRDDHPRLVERPL